MTTSIAAGGFTFDICSVGGQWYWTVRANNIRGSNQLYEIADIRTPFGDFNDVAVPLPGDVVLAMADTLRQFQQQLAPLLQLLSPGTVAFPVTITEGDPSASVAVVPFTNAGAFGSFLTAVATPDVPWLSPTPPVVAGLNKNDQGQFTVSLLPATLLSTGSPYSGHVRLTDNRTPPTVVDLTFTVTVLPRPVLATDVATVTLTYSIGLATAGPPQVVNVSNAGPAGSLLTAALAKVQNHSPWLAFSPSSVGPLAAAGSAPVTFSVVPSGVPGAPGSYTETILVSAPNAPNNPLTVVVTLVVSP